MPRRGNSLTVPYFAGGAEPASEDAAAPAAFHPAAGASTWDRRVDYMPSPAVASALRAIEARFEGNRQELLDYVLMCGISALQHTPWSPPSPHLVKRDRRRRAG